MKTIEKLLTWSSNRESLASLGNACRPAAPLAAGGKDGTRRISAGGRSRLGGVHVGFLLGLRYVLLVADPLISEPVVHLRYSNSTLPSELLLCLLAGVGVGQVGVEVLVQDLRCLLAKISPFSSCVKEP